MSEDESSSTGPRESEPESRPPGLTRSLQRISGTTAWGVVLLGAAVLAGWIFDIPFLIAPGPAAPAMPPVTALAFVCAGLALALHRRGGEKGRVAARALAVSFMALAAVNLLLYLGGHSLFRGTPATAADIGPRMSAYTAVALLLAGASMLTAPASPRRGRVPAEVLAALAGLAGWTALLGQAYDVVPLYHPPESIPMAFYTAVGLLLLSAGVLLAEPRRGWMAVLTSDTTGGLAARRLLPVSVAAPALLGWGLIVWPRRYARFNVAIGGAVFVTLCTVAITSLVVATAAVLKRLDDERRVAEERLRTVTGNATLGLFMTNEHQHCTFMNPAAEQITGLRLGEVQGKPLHAFVHHTRPDGRPYPIEECPIDRALPDHSQQRGEEVFVRPDGRFYPVAFTASPIFEGGRPVGTVVELRDTTEERRAESERERLLVELRRAVAARDEFLAIAAHELRTPLTSLFLQIGSASRVLERGLTEQQCARAAAKLRAAMLQTERLTTLINMLLDVSRIAMGRFHLERDRFDLVELAREVTDRIVHVAEKVGSDVTFRAAGPVTGSWDRTKLDQVLTNLLTNAVKYGPGKPIDVEVASADGDVTITVRDRGIGIAPGDLRRIFGRFERAVSSRHYGGLGIGLYLSRQIVEAHGGSIDVESNPGEGATFTVRLPVEQGGPETADVSPGPARAAGDV